MAKILGENRRTAESHIAKYEDGAAIMRRGVHRGGEPAQSQCEPYRESISSWVEDGLTAQRIYQDLVADHQFSGGYKCVQRLVRGCVGAVSYYQRSTQLLLVPLRSLTIRPCNCDAIVKKLLSADPLTRACRFFGTATVPE